MEFNKLSAPSLKELFIKEFETLILSGKIPVGEKLPPERELAASMQVSRAVVNAGITELARKGFLVIKPRIGTFVADYRRNGTIETLNSIMNYNGGILREAEIRSILELRIALDSIVIELCLKKITEEDILYLNEYMDRMKLADSIHEVSELAFSFQHELAILSGNTLIPLIFHSFKVPVLTLFERYCILYGADSLKENTFALFSSIKSRDLTKALTQLTQSIEETISGNKQIYY